MRNILRIAGLLSVVLMAISAPGQTSPKAAAQAVRDPGRELPCRSTLLPETRSGDRQDDREGDHQRRAGSFNRTGEGGEGEGNVLSKPVQSGQRSWSRHGREPEDVALRADLKGRRVHGDLHVRNLGQSSDQPMNSQERKRGEGRSRNDHFSGREEISARPVKPTVMYENG